MMYGELAKQTPQYQCGHNTGTVERDSNGRPYIQDEDDAGAIVYDTWALKTVKEIN